MSDYLATADVWTVLDLIVAEFNSDPMSVQCFDLRLVARAKELNRTRPPHPTLDPVAAAAPELLAALKVAVETIRIWHRFGAPDNVEAEVWALYQASPEMRTITAAIEKAESTS